MSRALLRLCLQAYPRRRRNQDGEVLLDLARELVATDDRRFAMSRQAVGLVRGGIAEHRSRVLGGVAAMPWRDALGRLVLPLAAANATVWAATLGPALSVYGGPGRLWLVIVLGSVVALLGTLAGTRTVALLGAVPVAAAAVATWGSFAFGHGHVRFPIVIGSVFVDGSQAWMPAALLLAVACAAGAASGRRPIRVGVLALTPALALGLSAAMTFDRYGAYWWVSVGPLLAGASLAVLGGVALAAARRGGAAALAAALVLAALTPALAQVAIRLIPIATGGPRPLHISLPIGLAAVAVPASACMLLARRSRRWAR
ncbi:MAG TPA: hypothetical protein VFB41_11575 [Solirubrobacteraceae bacterium]|nr:hypothetical protein [Solirubrobacteraceae bacterium]